jgi:release factor glutamine methyltransferase
MGKAGLFRQHALDRWLAIATSRLGQAGVLTPRFDAERIAAHGLGLSWGDLWTRRDDLDEATTKRLDKLLARRVAGEPLAYIEGSRGFYGLELECGPGVLVPRPSTETLVDVSLELIERIDGPVVVDIGTGTGAVALAIAHERKDAEVVATDISEDALAFARRNAASLGLDVWFAQGDLFECVPAELRGRVDLIVSNPPYVPDDSGLPNDVRAEPAVALFGGPLGEDVSRAIVEEAPHWLKTGGAVALEIGDGWQAGVLPGATLRNDLSGKPRVVWRRF